MHTVKSLIILSMVAGLCGLLLVTTRALTAQRIQHNHQKFAVAAIENLLGETLPNDFSIQNLPFVNCDHYVIDEVRTPGYVGEIRYLTLLRSNGSLSIRAVQHQETPGIGDFIDQRRSSWITQLDATFRASFTNLNNVSGATVTTNSVRRAALSAFERGNLHCE